jgi:hypothetical protein
LLDPGGRVLLLRYDNDPPDGRHWATPGGGLNPGETYAAAASRELAEPYFVEVHNNTHQHQSRASGTDRHAYEPAAPSFAIEGVRGSDPLNSTKAAGQGHDSGYGDHGQDRLTFTRPSD